MIDGMFYQTNSRDIRGVRLLAVLTLLVGFVGYANLASAQINEFQGAGLDQAELAISHRADVDDAKLVAAEKALLEGLSADKGNQPSDSDVAPPAPSQAQLQLSSFTTSPERPRIMIEKTVAPIAQREAALLVDVGGTLAPAAPSNPLKQELEASKKRIVELERKLEVVKGQLMMAETELSRLAVVSQSRTRASFGRIGTGTASVSSAAQNESAPPPAAKASISSEPMPGAADLMIVTVDVEKAELRVGPGRNNSSLMTVARGSRLAVEARQGEWYRVFAPNGQRAWILSKLVSFGAKSPTKQAGSAVKVRGYTSTLEDEAFRRVESITAAR